MVSNAANSAFTHAAETQVSGLSAEIARWWGRKAAKEGSGGEGMVRWWGSECTNIPTFDPDSPESASMRAKNERAGSGNVIPRARGTVLRICIEAQHTR